MSRKIDVPTAEHVFGFKNFILICPECELDVDGYYDVCHRCGYGKDHSQQPLPNYSTNISHAWKVVEKMDCYSVVETNKLTGNWYCRIGPNPGDGIHADTAPMAICLAALKAKGIEVDE